MKYALIGCGRISPNHIAAARNNGLDIIAICDIDPSCMADKILKFKFGASVRQYTDYTEMIEKEKPDLVAVCTESGKHAEIGLFCIEHGCYCIVYRRCRCDYSSIYKISRKSVCMSSEQI